MMDVRPEIKNTIFVVDDDSMARDSVCSILRTNGYEVEGFESGEDFLLHFSASRQGCLVLDLQMPGMSGLQLQEKLYDEGISLPIVMLSGFADVPSSVAAMERGAVTLLEKPFHEETMLAYIEKALSLNEQLHSRQKRVHQLEARVALLTPREREVMDLLVEGLHTKVIASRLGVSGKTIETHRANVLKKMQVPSVVQLVREALLAVQ